MFTALFLVKNIKCKMIAFFFGGVKTRDMPKTWQTNWKKLYSLSFVVGDENPNGKHDGQTESEDEMS